MSDRLRLAHLRGEHDYGARDPRCPWCRGARLSRRERAVFVALAIVYCAVLAFAFARLAAWIVG